MRTAPILGYGRSTYSSEEGNKMTGGGTYDHYLPTQGTLFHPTPLPLSPLSIPLSTSLPFSYPLPTNPFVPSLSEDHLALPIRPSTAPGISTTDISTATAILERRRGSSVDSTLKIKTLANLKEINFQDYSLDISTSTSPFNFNSIPMSDFSPARSMSTGGGVGGGETIFRPSSYGLLPPTTPRRASSYLSPPTSTPSTPRRQSTCSPSPSKPRKPRAKKEIPGGGGMFINFTALDSKKLLAGVAPSGSSKRRRIELGLELEEGGSPIKAR